MKDWSEREGSKEGSGRRPLMQREKVLLQRDIKSWLTTLQRAENLRKLHKRKERTRTRFNKNPFKFIKDLFAKEKSGILKTLRTRKGMNS